MYPGFCCHINIRLIILINNYDNNNNIYNKNYPCNNNKIQIGRFFTDWDTGIYIP